MRPPAEAVLTARFDSNHTETHTHTNAVCVPRMCTVRFFYSSFSSVNGSLYICGLAGDANAAQQ